MNGCVPVEPRIHALKQYIWPGTVAMTAVPVPVENTRPPPNGIVSRWNFVEHTGAVSLATVIGLASTARQRVVPFSQSSVNTAVWANAGAANVTKAKAVAVRR